MRTEDMYGHTIHPLGDTGYGVSLTFGYKKPDGPRTPNFVFFHNSDGFRQALFTLQIDKGETPQVCNIFRDRMDAVEAIVDNERLTWALANWKQEIANCANCHYHRHVARGIVPDYKPGDCDRLCSKCQVDLQEL